MSKPNQPSKPRQLIRKLITIHSAPGRSRQAVISGQAELDGEPDLSYRYVLMPVRLPG